MTRPLLVIKDATIRVEGICDSRGRRSSILLITVDETFAAYGDDHIVLEQVVSMSLARVWGRDSVPR